MCQHTRLHDYTSPTVPTLVCQRACSDTSQWSCHCVKSSNPFVSNFIHCLVKGHSGAIHSVSWPQLVTPSSLGFVVLTDDNTRIQDISRLARYSWPTSSSWRWSLCWNPHVFFLLVRMTIYMCDKTQVPKLLRWYRCGGIAAMVSISVVTSYRRSCCCGIISKYPVASSLEVRANTSPVEPVPWRLAELHSVITSL